MPEASGNQSHPEEGLWVQKVFKDQAQSLAEAVKEMGNPFLHASVELLVIQEMS